MVAVTLCALDCNQLLPCIFRALPHGNRATYFSHGFTPCIPKRAHRMNQESVEVSTTIRLKEHGASVRPVGLSPNKLGVLAIAFLAIAAASPMSAVVGASQALFAHVLPLPLLPRPLQRPAHETFKRIQDPDPHVAGFINGIIARSVISIFLLAGAGGVARWLLLGIPLFFVAGIARGAQKPSINFATLIG